MMLAICLSYTAFIMLRYIPSSPSFIRACQTIALPFSHNTSKCCLFSSVEL
jgi:hypothetical protein